MVKKLFLSTLIFLIGVNAHSANLVDVYQQALISDPIFQQAIAQRLVTKQGVPINVAALLPNIAFTANPTLTRTTFSGSNVKTVTVSNNNGTFSLAPHHNTQRAYVMTLSINQTIFNFAAFSAVAKAVSLSKGADATLNASLQNLMTRVSAAYFAILQDEDNLSYAEASKIAYAQQLDQVRQQYKVGLRTVTEFYTAQASYDSAVARYIAAKTALDNDRENLRVITGVYYPKLARLGEVSLVSPVPAVMEDWVNIALQQNWTIKYYQYALDASRENVRQQFAGHLPTLSVQGTITKFYENNINDFRSFIDTEGPGTQINNTVGLNLTVPIFSGGGVTALTRQASYQFQIAQQQLEKIMRDTANNTRQSYLNVISGISQISADKQAIKSNISSLEGLEASYRVGTTTLVDVLNQQQKLYEAQTTYSRDLYAYINNLLFLKQAAGTLSFDDLTILNNWLTDEPRKKVSRKMIDAVVTGTKNPPPITP